MTSGRQQAGNNKRKRHMEIYRESLLELKSPESAEAARTARTLEKETNADHTTAAIMALAAAVLKLNNTIERAADRIERAARTVAETGTEAGRRPDPEDHRRNESGQTD